MKRICFIAILCMCTNLTFAQVSFDNSTSQVTIDFDNTLSNINNGSFGGSGLQSAPSSGQLDGDAWSVTGMSEGNHLFGQTHTSGDFARGNSSGGVSSGGLYSFTIGSGNKALGLQPTGGDITPGDITLKINNDMSSSILQLDIDYKIVYRNDQNRSSSLDFSYSFDNVNFTDEPSADFSTPLTNTTNASWVTNTRTIALSNISIPPGQSIYIRWSTADAGGSGSRDEISIDDINITATANSNSCTQPNNQATNLTFSTITSNSLTAIFNPALADKFLAIRSNSSTLSALPADGTNYSIGASLGNGTVVSYDPSSSFTDTGLQPLTTYYYHIFSANDNCIGGPNYKTNSPLTGNIQTASNGNSGYYNGINGLTCETLKTALHLLIDNHTQSSYGGLWTLYQTTDDRLNDAGSQTIVWDVYSDNPTGSENEFFFGNDQCGTYSGEGDCYNREHSLPKSWWGGSTSNAQYTDAFHVVPVDGYINGIRSNLPYGEVQAGTETYISDNGTKRGSSSISIPGYGGSVFEPIDDYKGDLARNYFYMATRYENVIANWENITTEADAVFDGSSYEVFEDWALAMFIDWHNNDPVSSKEIERNDAVYDFQGNRNPFIDHPEYVNLIWGGSCGPDIESPTSPTNLIVGNETESTIDLSWNASNDNIGVSQYNIYRNGYYLTSVSSTSYTAMNLNEGSTYDFYVNAEDFAGNISGNSNTASATTNSSSQTVTVHEGYFESGWDGWIDGGSDCARYSGGNSYQGNYSIRIRDNSGNASTMTSPTFDLSSFSAVDFNFFFRPVGMDSGEDFFVQYNNGSGWVTIATYVKVTDFQNNNFYEKTISIADANYGFSSNSRFRIQCSASVNNDRIYVDQITITGTTGSSNMSAIENTSVISLNSQPELNEIGSEKSLPRKFTNKSLSFELYPNPASNLINIKIDNRDDDLDKILIMNLHGQIVKQLPTHIKNSIDINQLKPGAYLVVIIDNLGNNQIKRFIKI